MSQTGGPGQGTPRNHQVWWFEFQWGGGGGGAIGLVYIEIKAEK